MRIKCPSCAAEYEVEADMIPSPGRDVQCSACDHIWIQLKDGRIEQIAEAASDTAPSGDTPETTDTGAQTPPQTEVPEDSETAPARRKLDDETRRILVEEAQREATQRQERRRAAQSTLETQGDLGLNVASAAAATMAAAQDDPATGPTSRSEQLPDIEETNSSLEARQPETKDSPDPKEQAQDTAPEESNGFRGGFILMVVLALLLIALYLLAPRIATAVPELEPALRDYVDAANALRSVVNGALQSAADAIGSIAGSDG